MEEFGDMREFGDMCEFSGFRNVSPEFRHS
jgi:hypothetical protein